MPVQVPSSTLLMNMVMGSNTSCLLYTSELMIIPDAVHTDLYDRTDIIPFDKLEEFFKEYLK